MNKSTNGSTNLVRGLEKELKTVEQELEELNDYANRLRIALESLRTDTVKKASRENAHQASRTDTIKEILGNATEPITAGQIADELRKRGLPDDNRLINSTTSYLLRKGEAARVGRGLWVAAYPHKADAEMTQQAA